MFHSSTHVSPKLQGHIFNSLINVLGVSNFISITKPSSSYTKNKSAHFYFYKWHHHSSSYLSSRSLLRFLFYQAFQPANLLLSSPFYFPPLHLTLTLHSFSSVLSSGKQSKTFIHVFYIVPLLSPQG